MARITNKKISAESEILKVKHSGYIEDEMIALQILKREIQARVVPGLISMFQLRKRGSQEIRDWPISKYLCAFLSDDLISGSDMESEFSGQAESKGHEAHQNSKKPRKSPLTALTVAVLRSAMTTCGFCVWWFFYGIIIQQFQFYFTFCFNPQAAVDINFKRADFKDQWPLFIKWDKQNELRDFFQRETM